MVFADRTLTSEKRKRSKELGFTEREDRAVPFTRDEMADLAGSNIVDSGVEIEIFADLVTDLLRSFGRKQPSRIWQRLRKLARKIRQGEIEEAVHKSADWDGETSSLLAYLEMQLSPSCNQAIIGAIESALGLDEVHDYTKRIVRLPAGFGAPLIALDRTALRSILSGSPIDARSIEPLFKTAWKNRMVATAQQLAAGLAATARDPYGYCVASPQLWPSSGHLLLRTVTAPATTVQGIATLLPALSSLDDDEAAMGVLVANGLLAKRHVPALLAAGRQIRTNIDANSGMTIDVLNCLRHCADGCRPAARLVNGDMKAGGLDRREPIEALLGLTAAEAIAFVAEQLLMACLRIDTVTDIISDSPIAQPPALTLPPIDQVGILANIVAHEAPAYRYASGSRGVRDSGFYDPLDPMHHPMRKAVISMRRKLVGRLRGRFVLSFGIDPYACLG